MTLAICKFCIVTQVNIDFSLFFSDTHEDCLPLTNNDGVTADSLINPIQPVEHSKESLPTNKLVQSTEKTVSGDTIVSVTSDSAGLIPA